VPLPPFPTLVNRAGPHPVALETTLLVHGVPAADAAPLATDLARIVRDRGADPALVGVVRGVPTVGMTDAELADFLAAPDVPKANTPNLGVLIHRRSNAATTVSATMELAAAAGVRLFATGGIGGIHRDYAAHLDVSADLAALARFPVAVVTSGVKSLLDVVATREALESLGVPVVGFRTDRFPAFYLRDGGAGIDARFDDPADLAAFIRAELPRTRRGIVIANPIPLASELPAAEWNAWLAAAVADAGHRGVSGRAVTPHILSHLHAISNGRTLRANLDLVRSNTALAADLARLLGPA